MRVVTEVAAVDKAFDYLVPDGVEIGIGDRVRVDLHGRSVRGWVTDVDLPDEGRELKVLKKRAGFGPPPSFFRIARWASEHYVTPLSRALAAASAERNIVTLPTAPRKVPVVVSEHFAPGVWEMAPTIDPIDLVLSAYATTAERDGTLLVLVPTEGWAQRLTSRLVARGLAAVTLNENWAATRAGWPIVVGTRNGCFAPVPTLAGAVVLDADDEAFVSESSPTWEACRVVSQRCSFDGAPLWLCSALPSPTTRTLAPSYHVTSDSTARWPQISVVDRRSSDPRDGALSQETLRLVDRALHDGADGVRVAVILQRLGAGRLLACRQCGELLRCATCHEPENERDGRVSCREDHERREPFCRSCGAVKPRVLRAGVSTLARDVSLQIGRDVLEVTATTNDIPPATSVVVGTEAIFRLVRRAGLVVFVDFDQYLLGQRERARRDAIYAVAKAGRLVGARREGRGQVVIQTRRGDDDVIAALRNVDFSAIATAENATAQLLGLPPFGAVAEIGGAKGEAFATSLREAGVEVSRDGDRWFVQAPTHQELRALLATAPRPSGAMRLAIQ